IDRHLEVVAKLGSRTTLRRILVIKRRPFSRKIDLRKRRRRSRKRQQGEYSDGPTASDGVHSEAEYTKTRWAWRIPLLVRRGGRSRVTFRCERRLFARVPRFKPSLRESALCRLSTVHDPGEVRQVWQLSKSPREPCLSDSLLKYRRPLQKFPDEDQER